MLHYMGAGDGLAGWAHYYVQEGYRVYLVDRPGHGRAPYHPDALGPISPLPTYAAAIPDFRRATQGRNRQWPGTGDVGDPLVDQFMASQNATPQDQVMAHRLWASRGAELLDKIGPAIIQVHSAGGPFGWIVANERPKLVKAIVNVEGGGSPFGNGTSWGLTDIPVAYDPPVSDPSELATRDVTPPPGSPVQPYKLQAEPARTLRNLVGIPIVYVTAEQQRERELAVARHGREVGTNAGSGRRGVPEAGRLRRGGSATEGSRDPRQRPLHDVREQPPPGVRRHPRVDRTEGSRQFVTAKEARRAGAWNQHRERHEMHREHGKRPCWPRARCIR